MGKTIEASIERTDWVNGFLFVGNQLALDFLNTKLAIDGETIDKLSSPAAVESWCIAAGMLEADRSKSRLNVSEDFLVAVRAFRERLREAVLALESGAAPQPHFLKEENDLLSRYPSRIVLSATDGRPSRRTTFAAEGDGAFWGAIAASIAELLTELEPHRVRKCEHCVIHFYDSSKKGSRRWCSMGLCGNRLKVAAYQNRHRSVSPGSSQP